MEPKKREIRQAKKEIKQAGSQHRRRKLKQDLRENPEEAPYSEEKLGPFSTAGLNGIDAPRKRTTNPRRKAASPPPDAIIEPNKPTKAKAKPKAVATSIESVKTVKPKAKAKPKAVASAKTTKPKARSKTVS